MDRFSRLRYLHRSAGRKKEDAVRQTSGKKEGKKKSE
jgi:hypothetical protein